MPISFREMTGNPTVQLGPTYSTDDPEDRKNSARMRDAKIASLDAVSTPPRAAKTGTGCRPARPPPRLADPIVAFDASFDLNPTALRPKVIGPSLSDDILRIIRAFAFRER